MANACATTPSEQIAMNSPFPEPGELSEYTQKAPPSDILDLDGMPVESWELMGPLPTTIGASRLTVRAPIDEALAAGMEGKPLLQMTTGMQCAAREMGNFFLKNGQSSPTQDLRDFILRRCGTLVSHASTYYYTFDVTPGQPFTPDQFSPEFYTQLTKDMGEAQKDVAQGEVGVWFGQHEDKAVLYVAIGPSEIVLNQPIPMRPAGSEVTLEGHINKPAEGIHASVTTGEFGYERCAISPEVALPRFKIICPVNANDPHAMIALSSNEPGAFLAESVLEQTVWPGAEPWTSYEPSMIRQVLVASRDQGRVVEDASDPRKTMLDYINALRTQAQMEPLSLSKGQSDSTQQMAPFFFHASRTRDVKEVNKLSMGMLAGWQIRESIIHGNILTSRSKGEIVDHLANLLQSPMARSVVLKKEGDSFSAGWVHEEGQWGTVFLVHDLMEPQKHDEMVERALTTINRARTTTGRRAFVPSGQLASYSESLSKKVASGEVVFTDAANDLAERYVATVNSGVGFYSTFTHDLEDFTMHEDLMKSKTHHLRLMVTPFKPKGYPWTIYGIVAIVKNKE